MPFPLMRLEYIYIALIATKSCMIYKSCKTLLQSKQCKYIIYCAIKAMQISYSFHALLCDATQWLEEVMLSFDVAEFDVLSSG